MNKLCIIGVGLLGGSIGLDVIQKKLAKKVIGFGRNIKSLQQASNLGLVQEISEDYNQLTDADLIIIASPVKQTEQIFSNIKPFLSDATLITDVGSTKTSILRAAHKKLDFHFKNFIGSHPIAGSEKHGPKAAVKNLFVNKNIIITPHEQNNDDDIKFISDFWASIGGNSATMNAHQHDAIFSTVSHLPHALAMIFMNMLCEKNNHQELLNYAASGFKDFTRIAASSPEMWRDIFIDNKDACLKDLQDFRRQVDVFEKILTDEKKLEKFINKASQLRKDWHE